MLLDGVDEIPADIRRNALDVIERFGDECPTSRIVLTSRTQTTDRRLSRFAEAEIAEFNKDQVRLFIKHWFSFVMTSSKMGQNLVNDLNEPDNQQVAELAVTPLLLNLLCCVYRDIGHFPKNRTNLYRRALTDLLTDWDESRGIKREDVYGALSTDQKEGLLAHIAAKLFVNKEYFPKRDRLSRIVRSYLNITHSQADKIIRSIESQHGLLIERADGYFSYSHLTFQEYFAALYYSKTSEHGQLVKHVNDDAWNEIFLMASQLTKRPQLLFKKMKKEVDKIIARDITTQRFLDANATKKRTGSYTEKCALARVLQHFIVHCASNIYAIENEFDPDLCAHYTYDFLFSGKEQYVTRQQLCEAALRLLTALDPTIGEKINQSGGSDFWWSAVSGISFLTSSQEKAASDRRRAVDKAKANLWTKYCRPCGCEHWEPSLAYISIGEKVENRARRLVLYYDANTVLVMCIKQIENNINARNSVLRSFLLVSTN